MSSHLSTHKEKARQISLLGFLSGVKKAQLISQLGFLISMPGDDLLSHGETPHYHRRCIVSLPSSGWDRVVPILYGHQAKLVLYMEILRPFCQEWLKTLRLSTYIES